MFPTRCCNVVYVITVVFMYSPAWHPCMWHRSWVTWTSRCSYCSLGRIQTTRLWGVKRRYISPHVPTRQTSFESYCGMGHTSTPKLGYFTVTSNLLKHKNSFTGKLLVIDLRYDVVLLLLHCFLSLFTCIFVHFLNFGLFLMYVLIMPSQTNITYLFF